MVISAGKEFLVGLKLVAAKALWIIIAKLEFFNHLR